MNKIEQTMGYKDELEEFELATLHFSGHAIFCHEILSEETVELIKKALVLLKEIEKGEAYVARWEETSHGECIDSHTIVCDDDDGFTLGMYDSAYHHMQKLTFNNSPIIPTPKEAS